MDLRPLLEVVKSTEAEPLSPRSMRTSLTCDATKLNEPIDDIYAARLLNATDHCTKKAQKLLAGYMAWRQTVPGAVTPTDAWLDTAQVIVPFEDRLGRPVIIIRTKFHFPGKKQPTSLLESGYRATLDSIINHLLLNRVSNGGLSMTNPLEQFAVFLDLQGTGWKNFALSTIKLMNAESNDRYFDRMQKVYVLSPPGLFSAWWGLTSPILHPRTRRKVQIVKAHEVPTFVRDLIRDDSVIPREWGGMAPNWPEPSRCRTFEEKAGVLAANAMRKLGTAPVWDGREGELEMPSTPPRRGKRGVLCGCW